MKDENGFNSTELKLAHRNDLIPENLPELTNLSAGSLFAIIGSFAVVLLFLKGILIVFNLYVFCSHVFNIVAPWISSIFLLYFFIIFYRETLHNLQSKLKLTSFYFFLTFYKEQ